MALVTRRHLILLAGGAALFSGLRYGHARLARPPKPDGPLSAAAKELLRKAWQGLDASRVLDTHVHVVGLGAGGTGCTVGERMQSPLSPSDYFKFTIYLEAAGITDTSRADAQYVERLEALVRAQTPHGRLLLFPFDRPYDEAGRPLDEATEFFTPNDYVAALAKKAPDCFVACASVHPYRADAVEALEKAVEAGAVAVKWLPNAMNIDPSSPRCDAFYDALVRLQVPLITHAGEEKAVHAEEAQRLGNPLHLRRPLGRGVTVVVAHCASLGSNPDLDAKEPRPWVDNFQLFRRLMEEPQWDGKLFGEVSALPQVNRLGTPLDTVLADEKLQARCVNGSDYPLPAINALMQTRAVVEAGYLTEDERAALNEIDRHDPLLFDFALKRTLKKGGRRLADSVFMVRPEVFPRLA
ncbi:MAG: amidohydrolase family protein [Myxococcales bacterium]|nr:amidohydrolase family protein [Myxococcales bacterium]